MPRRDWQTPVSFFKYCDASIGGFKVDAAANEHNRLVERWYGPGSPDGEDALSVPLWLSPAWCNPPYLSGRNWHEWLLKFQEQSQMGVSIVALLPARTGTRWWADHVNGHADILFLTGRLRFTLPDQDVSVPNHDSALVLYHPRQMGHIGWMEAINDQRRMVEIVRGDSPDEASLVNADEVDLPDEGGAGAV